MVVPSVANREEYIVKYFTNYPNKAYLINAHGQMKNTKIVTVPEKTVIIFLAKARYCMNAKTGTLVQQKYFTSKKNILSFLKSGEDERNIHHVGDILTRTYIPGMKYPDLTITLVPDTKIRTMGFIKKLPTLVPLVNKPNKPPQYKNTIGPVEPGEYKLSDLVAQRSGLYIISTCRIGNNERNNAVPMNTIQGENGNYDAKQPARFSALRNLVESLPKLKSKPGGTRKTKMPPRTVPNADIRRERLSASSRIATARKPTKQLVSNAIKAMSTPGEVSRNIRNYIKNLPANYNVHRLNQMLQIMRVKKLKNIHH